MVRSSGEQPRDVKRHHAKRGGSIPSRAEQQEKSIFCNKHPRLKRYRPPERRTQGRQIHTHWRLGKTSKRPTTIGSKGLGNAHFFWQPERRQIKKRFTNGLPSGQKRRHSWQAWKASRGCNTPPYSSRFLPFLLFLYKIDAKHLAHAPGSNPGLATIYFKEKGEKECWII